jgi:prepilin-type N-terminal cleavage/methylation domain-containing protein
MIRWRNNSTRKTAGFTLLELLIALAMAAVVAVALVDAVRVAFGARQAAQRAGGPTRASEIALDFIRQDIAGAVPPNPNWTDPSGIVTTSASSSASASSSSTDSSGSTGTQLYLAGAFIGTDGTGNAPDDLIFYTTAEGPTHGSGDGEIKKVELTVDTSGTYGGDGVLVRRVLSNLTAPQQQSVDPDVEVLCRHVQTFNLRYYDGQTWQDSWDSTQSDLSTGLSNELPVAIEVTLELAPPADDPLALPKRYVRIYPVVCSTLINDQNNSSNSSTTGGSQ